MKKLPALLQRVKLVHPLRIASKSTYLAFDEETKSKFTLNVLELPRFSEMHKKMINALESHYHDLTTVTHHNIEAPDAFAKMTLKAFGSTPEECFLVLWPHIEVTLKSLIQAHKQEKTQFTESEILYFLRRAAGGLSAAHTLDVYHSNLHDQNVFFRDDLREPVIAEFMHPFHPYFYNPSYFSDSQRTRVFTSPEYREYLTKHGISSLGGEFFKKNDLYALGTLALKMAIIRNIHEHTAREALENEREYLKKNYPTLHYILQALIPTKLKNIISSDELFLLLDQAEAEEKDKPGFDVKAPSAHFKKIVKEQQPHFSPFQKEKALGYGCFHLGDFEDAIAHFEAAKKIAGNPDEEIQMWKELAKTHYNTNMLKSALEDLEQAEALLNKSKQDKVLNKIHILIDKAICYYHYKDVAQALTLASEAIRTIKEHKIKDDQLLVSCLDVLDKCQTETKQFEKSLSTAQEILEVTKQAFGDKSILTVKALHNLSNCYESVGDLANCLKYSFEAIRIFEETDLQDSRLLARLYMETADVQVKTKGHGAALNNYQKAIETLDTDVSELLSEIYQKAARVCFLLDNRETEGFEYLEKVISLSTKLYGEESEQYYHSLNTLADAYENRGLYEKSLEIRMKNLQEMIEIYGDMHHFVGFSQVAVGKLLKKQGEYKEAITYYQDAYEIAKDNESNTQLQSAVYFDYGVCLLNTWKFGDALKVLTEALKVDSKLYPENHPRILDLKWHLGLAQSKAGSPSEAVKSLLDILEKLKKDTSHAQLIPKYIYLVKLLIDLKDYRKALELIKSSLLLEQTVDLEKANSEEAVELIFAQSLEKVGERFMAEEEETVAQYYYLKAKKLFEKYGKKKDIGRVEDKLRQAINEEVASETDDEQIEIEPEHAEEEQQ